MMLISDEGELFYYRAYLLDVCATVAFVGSLRLRAKGAIFFTTMKCDHREPFPERSKRLHIIKIASPQTP